MRTIQLPARHRPGVALLLLLAVLAIATLCPLGASTADAQDDEQPRRIHVLHLDGPVTPVVVAYLIEGMDDAEDEGAPLVVIRVDTPGGNVEITRELTRRMRAAAVPIAVWVGPDGARAGSAGTFVTLAAHVAAMAPDTTIGAASPVNQQGEDIQETMRAKVENMLVEEIQLLAARRGPQVKDWVERAIRHADTASAAEAEQMRIVDLISPSIEDLVQRLDGRTITLLGAQSQIGTTGAALHDVPMSELRGVLNTLASPDLAYILMTLGMLGLIYEFSNPGFGFGGVVGAICLLLAAFGLGMLPATYSGVALILLAFALFFADIKLGTNGLLALGGVVALVLGGILLFDGPDVTVSPTVLVTVGICCGAFFVFAARMALRAQTPTATTGAEGLVGAIGVARTELTPDGIVVVWGENWRATSESGNVAHGAAVEVVTVNGLHVRVRSLPQEAAEQQPEEVN